MAELLKDAAVADKDTQREIVEALVARAIEADEPRPHDHPRTVMGISARDAARYLVAGLLALGGAYVGIRAAVDQNTRAVDAAIRQLDKHSITLDELDDRLDGLQRQADKVETMQGVIVEGIDEIKSELKARRRR